MKSLPKPIEEMLDRSLRRVRRVLWVRALTGWAATAIAALLAVMAIDAAAGIASSALRWGLSLAWMGTAAGAAWYWLRQPLSQRLGRTTMARLMDRHHPEWEERIGTTVELLSESGDGKTAYSAQLMDAVMREAASAVVKVIPRQEFSFRAAKAHVIAALLLALILILLLCAWPSQTLRLMARAVAPFAHLGNVESLQMRVQPGNAVAARGESLAVRLDMNRAGVETAVLESTDDQGRSTTVPMTRLSRLPDSVSRFEVDLPGLSRSFVYRVKAGRGVSDRYRVVVTDRPDIRELAVACDFPAYTRLPQRVEQPASGDVVAVAGTRVTITASLNKAVAAAEAKALPASLAIACESAPRDAAGQIVSFTMPKGFKGSWALYLRDEHGLTNRPAEHRIESLDDRKPEIRITQPVTAQLRMKPTDALPIAYAARDDFGLSAVDLLLELDGKAQPPVALRMPEAAPGSQGAWNGSTVLELATLPLENVQRIRFRLRVSDTLPKDLHGPQTAESEAVVIAIDRGAQSFVRQAFEEQAKDMRRELNEAIQDVHRAYEQAANKDQQAAQQDKLQPWLKDAFRQSAEHAAKAEERLREMAERAEGTPFDRLAEPMRKVAENKLQEARAKAGELPLEEDPKQRQKDSKAMENALGEARDEMHKLDQELDKAAAQARDLARLAELAAAEEQLARAADRAKEAGRTAPDDSWKRDQADLTREVGSMVQQSPEAMRDRLAQDARQASELQRDLEKMASERERVENVKPPEAGQDATALKRALLAETARRERDVANDAAEIGHESSAEAREAPKSPTANSEKEGAKSLAEASRQANDAASDLNRQDLAKAVQSASKAQEKLEQAAGQMQQDTGSETSPQAAQEASRAESAAKTASETAKSADKQSTEGKQSTSAEQSAAGAKQSEAAQQPAAGEQSSGARESPGAEQPAGSEQSAEAKPSAGAQPSAAEAAQSAAAAELAADAGNLADRQEQLVDAMKALQSGDAAGALDSLKKDTQQQNAALSEEMGALQSRASALGVQPAPAQAPNGQGQQGGQPTPAQQAKGLESGIQQRRQQQGGSPSPGSLPMDGQALSESLEQASAAAAAQSGQRAAQAATQASRLLAGLADEAARSLGMDGMPSAAEMAAAAGKGQSQAREPQSDLHGGTGGTGPVTVRNENLAAALAELGISTGDWARVQGDLRGGMADGKAGDASPEYREMIKQYFIELARRAEADRKKQEGR